MSKVLVDYKRIEEIRTLKVLGRGKEGSCYLLNDQEVIKLYHILQGNRKIYFEGFESGNISFPKDILFYSDRIIGYTMNYLHGEKIINGFKRELELEKLKQMYIDIRNVINDYDNIYMEDFCLENILLDYQSNKFNLIDTSRWYLKENSKDKNIMWLNKSLVYVLLRKNLECLNECQNKSKQLFELYRLYKLGCEVPFLELLDVIKDDVEKKSNFKIKTLSDMAENINKY